jgi:hypothetical protein
MRALLLALAMLVVPSAAFAGTDIVAVCYKELRGADALEPRI